MLDKKNSEVSVFDVMSVDEIDAYLALLPREGLTLSIILTDGAMLTGHYVRGHLPGCPILEAVDDNHSYRVIVPSDRIAGILDHVTANPLSTAPSAPSLLLHPAGVTGLNISVTDRFGLIEPGGDWRRRDTIFYGLDTILYLDANAVSARSGGINGIGGGFLASAQVNWAPKLVSKATKLLKRHLVAPGSHCGQAQVDFAIKGYAEFFDVTNVEPDEGPLLLLKSFR